MAVSVVVVGLALAGGHGEAGQAVQAVVGVCGRLILVGAVVVYAGEEVTGGVTAEVIAEQAGVVIRSGQSRVV